MAPALPISSPRMFPIEIDGELIAPETGSSNGSHGSQSLQPSPNKTHYDEPHNASPLKLQQAIEATPPMTLAQLIEQAPPPSSQRANPGYGRPDSTAHARKPLTPRIDGTSRISGSQLYHDEACQASLISDRRYDRERTEFGRLLSRDAEELEEPFMNGALAEDDDRCEVCYEQNGGGVEDGEGEVEGVEGFVEDSEDGGEGSEGEGGGWMMIDGAEGEGRYS